MTDTRRSKSNALEIEAKRAVTEYLEHGYHFEHAEIIAKMLEMAPSPKPSIEQLINDQYLANLMNSK